MNLIKKHSALLLLIVALSLPWTSLQALETFHRVGDIASTGIGTFTIGSQTYTLAPKVNIKTLKKESGKASNLKPGDSIVFRGRILNSVHFVDKITYIRTDNR